MVTYSGLTDRGVSCPSVRRLLGLICTTLLALALLGGATALPASALPGACPNEAIRVEQHATFLPDCRAYEQVSPAAKNGGLGGVFPLGELTHSAEQVGRPLQSSADGNAIAYRGEDFYQPLLGSLNQYLSARNPAGWITSNITPGVPSTREAAIEANTHLGLSADLSAAVLRSNVPLSDDPAAPPHYANLYLAGNQGLEAVIAATPPNRPARKFGFAHPLHGEAPVLYSYLFFGGANSGTPNVPAFSHILFAANDALTSNATDGGYLADNLYEWSGAQLRLVNELPNGEAPLNASFGVDHYDEYHGPLPNLDHVISADGSRIFWTDQSSGDLYLREDGIRTKQVDASLGGGGEFQTASADGSLVLFTKNEHLYRYEVETGQTTDLSQAGEGGGVLGILGTSEDGSSVYFVSTSLLSGEQQNQQGAEATIGKPNLYLSQAGHATYVATLLPADNHTPELYGSGGTPEGDWYRTFAGRTSMVSPDGRYVAFMSAARLTGYDNTDARSNRPDYQAFIYDSKQGALVCASCNTDGSRPTASTLLPAPLNGMYQQRYLDNSGRLFFSTEAGILPQDRNAKMDVFEYQSGDVHLISPASTNDEAVFADASESGDDVFFTTRQQLAGADHDQIVDLYDARARGGFKEAEEAIPCGGEACKGALPQAPAFQLPGSSGFSAPAGPAPRRNHHRHHRPRHHRHRAGAK